MKPNTLRHLFQAGIAVIISVVALGALAGSRQRRQAGVNPAGVAMTTITFILALPDRARP